MRCLEKAHRLCDAAFGVLLRPTTASIFRAVRDPWLCRRLCRSHARARHTSALDRPARTRCCAVTRLVHVADLPGVACRSGGTPSLRVVDVWPAFAPAHACRCGRTAILLGFITGLSPGGAPVLRQADRAAGELRGPGGDRDGERAAAGRNPPAPGGTSHHVREHGRRRRHVRRNASIWSRGTASSRISSTCPTMSSRERRTFCRVCPLPRRAW